MINFLAICACVMGMSSSLACTLGYLKSVYVLGVVNGCVFVLLNAAIALASPAQRGVAVMIIPSVWLIVMSIVGLLRLRREGAKVQP